MSETVHELVTKDNIEKYVDVIRASRITRIEYPFDGEGTTEWPKDLLPAEKIEEKRVALIETLKQRVRLRDPNSEEGFKLVFKLASYDLRDGLNLARATGMHPTNMRSLIKMSQLPIYQPVCHKLEQLYNDNLTKILNVEAQLAKTQSTSAENDYLKEELLYLRGRDIGRGSVHHGISLDEIRGYVLEDVTFGHWGYEQNRRRGDSLPVHTDDERLIGEIQTLYSSVAFHQPYIKGKMGEKRDKKVSLDVLTSVEEDAIRFSTDVFDNRKYDQRTPNTELINAVATGRLLPQITAFCHFPSRDLGSWTTEELIQAKEMCGEYLQTLTFDEPLYQVVLEIKSWLIDETMSLGHESTELSDERICGKTDHSDYMEVHDWFIKEAKRAHSLTELHQVVRHHLAQLYRVRSDFELLLAETVSKNIQGMRAWDIKNRLTGIKGLIIEFEILVDSQQDTLIPQNRQNCSLLKYLWGREDPFYELGRVHHDFVGGGTDGGNHRPLLLGIGLPARCAQFSDREALDLFADLFPETTAAMGGKSTLEYHPLDQAKRRYQQGLYRQDSEVFQLSDDSLNYDGDPREEGMTLATFSEPYDGVLIQGLYGTYDHDKRGWKGREYGSEPVEDQNNFETKDTVLGITVWSSTTEKKIQLPQSMDGQIVIERVMGYVSSKRYIPLKTEKNERGEIEVTIPPCPPGAFISQVYYAFREPVAPRLPQQPTEEGYQQWLEKQGVNKNEFLELRKEAWRTLPPECQALLKAIKQLSPLERVLRIQEYIHQIGFYDMDNGELAYVKNTQTREERFETMRVRIDELRQRHPSIPGTKHYAGVCVDFEELSSAMLIASGIKAGKATGISVHGETDATSKNLHAFSYVPFPDTSGKRMVLEVDATPAVTHTGNEAVLVSIRQRSLRDRLEEEGIVWEEGERIEAETESDVMGERVGFVTEQTGTRFTKKIVLEEPEAPRILKELTPEEQNIARVIAETLSPQERSQLMALRDTLFYSPIKHTLGQVVGVEKKVALMQILIPALESSVSYHEDDAQKVSAHLLLKWRSLLEEWNALLTPEIALEAMRACADALKASVSPALYQAFLQVARVIPVKDTKSSEQIIDHTRQNQRLPVREDSQTSISV